MKEKDANNKDNLTRLVAIVMGLPWVEILPEVWQYSRKLIKGLTSEGMYEVLDFESTLELHDAKGKNATYQKRMKIRYLQNEIIAFQDYGWGDGDVLKDYKTNRGIVVDEYKSGYKKYLLLSLREVKNRGDIDEFNISWKIHNGFLKKDGYWSTHVSHRMKNLKSSIIFPKSRAPQRVYVEESNHRKSKALGSENQKRLSDGRWLFTWKTASPKLYEAYVLRWDW